MLNKRKKVFILYLITAMLFLTCFGTGAVFAAEKIRVGVFFPALRYEWFRFMDEALQKAAGKLNAEIRIYDGNEDPNTQLKQVEDFISRGKASFVIYTPVTPAAGKSGMRQFNAEGIPVVMFDRYTAFGDRITFVEYDAYNRGQIAANEIMKDAKKRGLRKANVCFITGKLSDKPAIDTKAGFDDVVDASGGFLNVMSELDGGWQQLKATEITEDWLNKYKKIDYIFGSNPDMGLGISVATKAAGRREIKVVAGGEAKGVYEAIYSGDLWMTTGTNPKNIILWCLKLGLMDTVEGYPFQYMDSLPSHILTPLSVITKENIQEEWNKLWPNDRLK